jgi:hypothetical protein
MRAEYLVEQCKDPLHDRELQPQYPVGICKRIDVRIQDVEVITVEIINHILRLCLPPYVYTYEVPIKNMEM